MVSGTANDVIGAIGGCCFAACLAPQIWKLYKTRSARDISYAFMALYLTGAILFTIYLYSLEDALVAAITIVVELAITLLCLLAKIYLDIWGPHPVYGVFSKSGPKGSTQKPTLKQAVFTDISKFLSGEAGAPFPLVQHEEGHAAQHLLLDCTIRLSGEKVGASGEGEADDSKSNGVKQGGGVITTTTPTSNGTTTTTPTAIPTTATTTTTTTIPTTATATVVVDDSTALNLAEQGSNDTSSLHTLTRTQEYCTAINVLSTASDLLKNSLQDVGLQLERSQYRQLSSFKSSLRRRAAHAAASDHQMVFIGCNDGYTSLIWYEDSCTLAVDFLAAGEESSEKMNEAAQLFGKELLEVYPGSRIEASVIPRLRKKVV